MKKAFALVVSGVSALMMLGCGGGGGGGTPPVADSEKIVITSENSEDVLGTVSSAIYSGMGLSDMPLPLFKSTGSDSDREVLTTLNSPILKTVSAATVAMNEEPDCDSGSYSYTSDGIEFDQCTMGEIYFDGKISASQTASSTTIQYTNFTLEMLGLRVEWESASTTLTYNMSSSYPILTSLSSNITGMIMAEGETINFTEFKHTISGLSSETVTMSIDGYLSLPCIAGWVQFTTVEPIVLGASCPVSGQLTLSGGENSTLSITFEDGSVSITGMITENYESCLDVPTLACPV